MDKIKAIGLYSGGLDSILAIQIILEAAKDEIEIIPTRFITAFFDYKNDEEFKKETEYLKEKFGLVLRVVGIIDDYLKILNKPKFGYGKNLNPCIDCKILMLAKAKEIMEKEKADFIFTGEVVGQRPKSQKMDTMRIIEREAGLDGYLVRPLSAKLLKETIPEKEGLLKREALLGLNGRGRGNQLELAKKYGIQYFATPSGGCLLTDIEYARKLKIIKDKIGIEGHLLKFLSSGRAFIINKNLFIVGRNEKENKKIIELANEKDLIVEANNISGPACIFLNGSKVLGCLFGIKKLKIVGSICAYYISKKNKKENNKIEMNYIVKDKEVLKVIKTLKVSPIKEEGLREHKV